MDKENVKADKPAEKKNQENNEECNFIYFIDTHEKTKKFKIFLPDGYDGADSLTLIEGKETKNVLNELISEVYRFKIIPGSLKKDEEQKYQILVFAEGENGEKRQYKIEFKDETKNFYEYDFSIEEIDLHTLSHEEQFEIYVEILKKTYKKDMNTKEKENLVLSTHEFFNEKGKKYNFFFYLLIFIECFKTKVIQQHLLQFTPEKIEGLGKFPEASLKKINNILQIIGKNPSKSLNLHNLKDEAELVESFYSILLYFNMNFQKDKVLAMFQDEKILPYLSKKLISFRNLYKDLKLPKDIVRNLLKKSKTFEEILGFLYYIGDDIIDFLQLILSEFEFIKHIYSEDLEKLEEEKDNNEQKDKIEMKKIDVEKYVTPKRNDKIEKLVEVSSLVFVSEKTNNIKMVKFSERLIGKYIEFFNGKSLDSLQMINNLILLIKKDNTKFEFKYNDKDIDTIIHDTGIELIKRREMENISILDFITSDIYFISEGYEKLFYRPLEVFDGINIETIDDNFFNRWKEVEFNKIYKKSMEEFYKKIISLINDMKDFGLLFKFLLFRNNDVKEYQDDAIKYMKERYIDLFPTYKKEVCPDFVNDTIKLISLLAQKKIDTKDLLEFIQINLDYEKVNEIYKKLSDEYKNLNNKTKEEIVSYFINNKNNANPSNLVNLIKDCKNLRKEILNKINNYSLSEIDFWSIEETENYKLYKGLIDNKIIDKEFEYKGADYLIKVQTELSALEEEIKNYEVKYSDISIFFQDEKNKNLLKEKLLYLNISDEKKQKTQYDILEKKFDEINKKIVDFELIYSYFRDFFPQKYDMDLEKLTKICYELKNENLNYFEKKLIEDYNNYSKYKGEAKRLKNLQASTFFNEILKYYQNNEFKNNEEKALEETEKEFKTIKDIFQKKGINKIKDKILEICIQPFKENMINLKKELIFLKEFFKVEGNIDDIYEDILLFSKRELIFNTANSLYSFIEKIHPKKTDFFKNIEDIITKIKEKKDIEVIKQCNNKLIDLNIFDGEEKQNQLIIILNKFKEQPESFEFLLQTSIEDIANLEEMIYMNENNFVEVNDLLNMRKCVEFFNNIGKLDEIKKMEDFAIIEKMRNKVKEDKNIYIYFEKYVNNYSQIQLLKKTINRSEFLKYKIKLLFDGCAFFLSNEKTKYKNNDQLLFECKIINEKNKVNILSREEIISLRDRALLSKKITADYQYFIDSITEIINISNILKEIYIRGYPAIIKINIIYKVVVIKESEEKMKITPQLEYFVDEKNKTDFKEIINDLKNILSELKEKQINGYKTIPLIRYLYGLQFNLLYNYLGGKNKNQMESLLKYITNDSNKKIIDKFDIKKGKDLIQNNIEDWNVYLKKILEINNLTLENIYKPTLIIKKNLVKNTGIFTYKCDKPEKNLFQIYKYLTGHNPIAQNILLCNKMTSNEEIASFIFRALLCEFNSCFIVAGSELLETEKKTTILELLNNFFIKENEKEQMNSCLIFLFSDSTSDIYKGLEMKKYRQILNITKAKFEGQKYEGSDIEIIKSDKSGVGKSKKIELDVKSLGKKRIYFPIGGAFSQEDIISRLKKLKIDNNCVLHLDLYDTDETNLMMEFLFSVLILRFYGQNENIFYLSKNIQIKVEIPNTFINFFEKFSILGLFNVTEIKIAELAPLIVPKDISSNIEVIANYLKALKENKIDRNDFIFPKITPDFFQNRFYIDKNKNRKTTSLSPELISPEDCQKLIFGIIKEKIKEPNYYQIISFINVLAIQLKKLNSNVYLNAYDLIFNGKSAILPIRTFIVNSFISLTSHFTEGAFSEILKSQEKVSEIQFGQYDEKEDLNTAINNLAKEVKDVISYDKINPSLVFFHEKDGYLFSIITNKPKSDKEYQDLLNLKNSQFTVDEIKKNKAFKELPDYKHFGQDDFLKELGIILDIKNPVKNDPKNEKISLEEITGDYVITPDNFVKMILVLLRLRSGIPVIMMGETGCGKTSLIRKLSELRNNGDKTKMKTLNIHAGTNDDDIIKFINDIAIPEAINIAKNEAEFKQLALKSGQTFEETKLWVFLDEINTCKSMGLISELMCKHTCQGEPLPENIVFIAACNPYRMRKKKKGVKEEQIGLDINQAQKEFKQLNEKEVKEILSNKGKDLVYTVNPLPHSLLNFVFYFGKLKPEDEKNYIKCIIKKVIEKIYYKGNTPKEEKDEDNKIKKFKKLSCDMIWASQEYIREKNDESAVSLREIRRVNIFYEFFYNYLNTKKEFYLGENQNLYEEDSEFYKKLDDYSTQIYAMNLSIFVCYYLRITNKEQRNELNQRLNDILNKFEGNVKIKDFLDLPLKEEKFIVKNINLNKGIAQNRALLENIFSLFVAINSKVPIFIVGKPGCSKSLSFQLITRSMQGTASEKPFFKELPRTIIHAYQGSLASTSKGVENVFEKARETLKQLSKEDKKKNISLIYFDEMGLAEKSPNNPLKVIHAELEYDQNEDDKQVAFVGISNWNLDAAKMNRGISISIPEPDEEDNKETAFTIGNSYDNVIAQRYKNFLENLGISYYNYKQYLKKNHSIDKKEDFHGNRDFYHLVKNSTRNMLIKEKQNSLNEQTLLECAIDSIERNFSGILFEESGVKKPSLEIFKDIFHTIYPGCQVKKEYDALKRIKENINDLESRYLLISSENSIGTYLLSSILENENKEYNFYIGSPFEHDKNSEGYALKVLNRIQEHMERGNILILKDLEPVYPSMYDLFNQNFTVIGGKNYSRLAIGSNTNTFAFVNNNFRCIVDVKSTKLDEEEAPFLNRFEKHIMSFEYLMNEELIKIAEKIKKDIDGFFKCDTLKFKAINYDLKKLMINCNKDEIQALVYTANKNGIKNADISDYVLEKISMTLPQDILVNLKISGQKQDKNLKKILGLYYKGEHANFCKFLEKTKNQKNIIYTFSGYLEEILEDNEIINNSIVGEINNKNIKIIQLNSVQSEREFETHIDEYLKEDQLKVCIIKFLPYEGSYMNYIKYSIENEINKNKSYEKKLFVFIVYMSRIPNKELKEIEKKTPAEQKEFNKKILSETLSNLSGFNQIFIDNLNGDSKFKIEQLLKMNRTELFKALINPDEELMNNIFNSISYMQYNIAAPYKGLNGDNYVDNLSAFISNNKRLRNLINETIFKKSFEGNEDIIMKIFKDSKSFTGGEIEILSVIKNYLSSLYIKQLNLLFFKAEKDQFFSSLLSNNIEKKIWPRKNDKNEINNDQEIEEEINLKKEEIYEDKTVVEKIAKYYLETIVYNDGKTNIVEKIGANKVNIILGFKIPGIKPIFDRILNSFKDNILKNYRKNEDNLRNYFEEAKNKYFESLTMFNNSLYNVIDKEEGLKNILNLFINKEEEEKEINDLLINDYYSLFLNNNINKSNNKKENGVEAQENLLLNIDNLDNNIKYLKLIVDQRNNLIKPFFEGKNIPNNKIYEIATTINWIESYSE